MYAAQFRDFHTAMHNIALFEDASDAEDFLDFMQETGEFPLFCPVVTIEKINFRTPPQEHEGEPLEYVNPPDHLVPDCY